MMKTSTVVRHGVTPEMLNLMSRWVKKIPWPQRRSALGEVIISLLDGKPRVAEKVFGWNRKTAELGLNEYRTQILGLNDLSKRRKPKVEEKNQQRLTDLMEILEPLSQSESHLRTTLW